MLLEHLHKTTQNIGESPYSMIVICSKYFEYIIKKPLRILR